MTTRTCLLSLDVEEDFVDGVSVSEFFGVDVLPLLLPIFDTYSIRVTLFCTGEVLKRYGESILSEFLAHGHEIALHGFYDHVNMREQTLEQRKNNVDKHLALYKKIFSELPKGFRAVQNTIDYAGITLLQQSGVIYDSSIISRYPPLKQYIGYEGPAPAHIYRPAEEQIRTVGDMGIVEIPLVPLVGGVQLQGRWIQRLGTTLVKQLLVLHKPQLLSFSFHSWDLVHVMNRKEKNQNFLDQIEDLIHFLKKQQYQFFSGKELYERFQKNTYR